LLLVDEFYFIKSAMYATFLALLANGAAFLIVSSMAVDSDGEITRMLHAVLPDGSEVMLRLNWIRACADCLARNEANFCTHLVEQPQHFQQRGDQARLKALLKSFGDAAYAREMLNVGARPSVLPAFPAVWLQPLRDRTLDVTLPPGRDYRYFFVSCDPAGGGFSQSVYVSLLCDSAQAPSPFVPYMALVRSSLPASQDTHTHRHSD